MSDRLNVIALISGGKDSFFSLLQCIENGHNVVALANLYPPSDSSSQASRGSTHHPDSHGWPDDHRQLETAYQVVESESADLDSFMYQTVGHSLIPLYSTVLQLPLYRRVITGASIQQSQYYDTSTGCERLDDRSIPDETEDLIPLLREVISTHPEANAVSAGAILSTYQRTRIESIAVRLNLTPLSYLWQYPILPPPENTWASAPQTSVHRPDSLTGLLEDIASSGLDARLIKIASAGIPETLLFATLADSHTQKRLVNSLAPFFEDDDEIGLRGAALGEGGEYETIVLNGPKEVWKGGKIVVDETVNESYAEGGVIYVKIRKARVVSHDETIATTEASHEGHRASSRNVIAVPALFDQQFESTKKELKSFAFDVRRRKSVHRRNDTTSDLKSSYETSHISGPAQPLADEVQGITQVSTSSAAHSSVTEKAGHKPEGSHLHHRISFSVTPYLITVNNLTSASVVAYLESDAHMAIHDSVSAMSSPTSQSASSTFSTAAASQLQVILSHLPAMFAHVSKTLSITALSATNISNTTLLLSSISDFVPINPIYSGIYPAGLPNPPARVTIAAPLPLDTYVSLSLTLDLSSSQQRRGLHVQGRSYWAPANIGPYSQAIAVPITGRCKGEEVGTDDSNESDNSDNIRQEIVYIAGQIPLVPSSMEIYTGTFIDTALLSLQHLWRIGQERGVDFWPWGVAYLAESVEADVRTRVDIAAAVWKNVHLNPTWAHAQGDENSGSDESDEDEVVDIWDIQRNRSLQHGFRPSKMSVGKHLHVLPNHSLFHRTDPSKNNHIPPFIAAEVIALPRNVSIEWWSNGIAGFTRRSTLPRPSRLGWRNKSYDWGSLSSLTIVQDPARPTNCMKFITYLVSSASSITIDNLPTSLSQIMHLIGNVSSNDSSDSNNTNPINARLVQGTVFVSFTAHQSNLWDRFTASIHPLDQPHLQPLSPLEVSSGSQPLGSCVNVIPCHRLWGRAATTVQRRGRSRGDRQPEQQTNNHEEDHDVIDEIVMAFVLRVEVYP